MLPEAEDGKACGSKVSTAIIAASTAASPKATRLQFAGVKSDVEIKCNLLPYASRDHAVSIA